MGMSSAQEDWHGAERESALGPDMGALQALTANMDAEAAALHRYQARIDSVCANSARTNKSLTAPRAVSLMRCE